MADSLLFLHGSVITLVSEVQIMPLKLNPYRNWIAWIIKRQEPLQRAL